MTAAKDITSSIDYSVFPPGYTFHKNGIVFRLFAPRADDVELHIFDAYEHGSANIFAMTKDSHGLWNFFFPSTEISGKWYAYKIHSEQESPFFQKTDKFIADPWSRHVTSRNHYLGFHKTKIAEPESFDWEDDTSPAPSDLRDLIIYETHIKDMVAHSSAKTYVQGVYNDFREAEVGGIRHLKKIGVNAVEFLPLQKFAYVEPPFNEKIGDGLVNSWNPYARNYWGYMTSFFLAPESIYASDGSLKNGDIVGKATAAERELKQLVKEIHKQGICVIMDVVFNHASQYDLNPLKYTAKDHYFRLDEAGHYLNDSWTGNDIKTDSEFSRRLIIDSVMHWMKEYHIDGFRFDLAGIIDWDTVDAIKAEAEKINPNVILIAEPWGGEYKPQGFSDHGWASWNDRLRNGFKGYDPINNKGLIFGSWSHGTTRFALENFIRGTLENADHGLFNSSEHAVNYLESHDGYTLGDFIRIALNPSKKNKKVTNKITATKLTKREEAVAKLAALSLFVSQGITMIHAGQEWARSKVITDPDDKDENAGKFDHDSYNKDNATNWLNFNEAALNKSLFEYYLGLIELRKKSPALRKTDPDEIVFRVYNDPLHLTFSIDGSTSRDNYDYFISLNGNLKMGHEIVLPEGKWEIVANQKECNSEGLGKTEDTYNVAPSSGVVLRKLRVSVA